jgi:aryl-alcohol dehydrogenase-like predicted oxidoreductase
MASEWAYLILISIMSNKKIILGTVQMGLPYGINNTAGKVPVDESQNILQKAYEAGIRELDTAEAYGTAHQVIGDFHRANLGKIFDIITKIPPSDDLIDIEDKLARYLVELNVKRLKGLMFHSFNSYIEHRDIIPAIKKLKKEGVIEQLGISIYTNDELEEINKEDEIDLIQMPFNLLDNYSLRGKLILEAKRKGKTIHTRSVFLQGLFFRSPMEKHPIIQSLHHQLLKIQEIAEEQGISITSLALSYCLQQSDIDKVLIGVDSLKHLESNLAASNYKLDEQLIQKIDKIQTENPDLLNPSLW